jgi:RNA polymerase sigma factor (sigma-70 family)
MAAERTPRSLDAPADAGETEINLADRLPSPGAEDAYERVESRVATERLPVMLEGLSERERAILRGRYGLDGREQTLRQLGTRLGVSDERVRQIEQGALGKLRAASGATVSSRTIEHRRRALSA